MVYVLPILQQFLQQLNQVGKMQRIQASHDILKKLQPPDPKCIGCIQHFNHKQGVFFSNQNNYLTMNVRKFLNQLDLVVVAVCALLNSRGGYILALAGKYTSSGQYFIEGIELDKQKYQQAFKEALKKLEPYEKNESKKVKLEFLEVRPVSQSYHSQQPKYGIRISVRPEESNWFYYIRNQRISQTRFLVDELKSGKITMRNIKVENFMFEIGQTSKILGFKTPHECIKCRQPSISYTRDAQNF